jgi:hypothetical protein
MTKMHLLTRAACAMTALLLALPAHGQDAPPPPEAEEEIVVTGRQLDEQVHDFVGALTPSRGAGSTISRFEEAVCPAVRGFTPAQNETVTARLRAVAAAAGVQVERPGCVPDSLLIVTADKDKFIRTLASRRPETFGDLTPVQIRELARSPGPAAAWQLKGMVNSDGQPILLDGTTGVYLNRTTQAASRGRPEGRWVFEGSALVVERSALVGLTTTQIADYAAMRLFARTDPTRVAGKAPTILTILEAPMGSEIPITLTQWDLAFLRGLYASPENRLAGAQRSAIAQEMRGELGRRQDGD